MRMGRLGVTRPENFPKQFNVYGKAGALTDIGRPTHGEETFKGTLRAILAVAKPEERLRYNQLGVNVTHTLLQRGMPQAKEQDVVALVRNGTETRRFRIQTVHNKGTMDIHTVYYCEERSDLR